MSKQSLQTKRLITLAILSAIGTILMYIEIPSPTAWLMIDISDVVVYITAVIYGPVGAIIVAFLKSAIHFLLKNSVVGLPINQFIAFIASLAYALPLYYMLKVMKGAQKGKFKKFLPMIVSSLCLIVTMTVINYWLTDVYIRLILTRDITQIGSISHTQVLAFVTNDLGFSLPKFIQNARFLPKDLWLWFIVLTYVPFNFIKSLITSTLYFILSYRLAHFIERFKISRYEDSILLQINEK